MATHDRPFPKVLLIEDDTFLLGMYVTKLQMEHFDTLIATEGEKGLQLAQQHLPDLILLDILLPKMDGFVVLEELKRNPTTRSVPVILLTNLGQKKDIERGLSLGANDYLIKAHFMPSEVIEKIKRLIDQTRTLRSLS